jgi:hypothetical protein
MPRTLKIDVVRRLTATWRTCREHYPGWVIAPSNAREALIQYTDQWLDPIFSCLPELPAVDALRVLAETVWRMDIALVPLTVQQAQTAETVLERINPARSTLSWPADPEIVLATHADSELTYAWMLTAFAAMREAREDLDVPRFKLWCDRLDGIVRDTPEWLARWHYEKALMALWRLDLGTLEAVLNDWPVQLSQLPFWEVKRAGLWGELGDIRRAELIAESALDTIRQRTKTNLVDYQSLSEEGWAMRLLMALRTSRAPFDREADRARFQDRFADLSRYKCNPWETTDWFELALQGAPPELRPEQTETRTFDPGTYSTHYASQEIPFKKARPAFAFLRTLEEAAIPLKLGRLAMLGTELKQVPHWIAPFAFLWAVSTAIRADEENVVEALLDRTNIGTLKQVQAESLADWLTEVCERSLKQLTQVSSEGWNRAVPERILGAVTEALSRLIVRVDETKIDRVVALAEQICRIKDRQMVFGAMKHVDAIFRRAIEWCMTTDHLSKRLANWLELPLPSEMNSPDMDAYDRAEPFHHIRIRSGMRWNRPADSGIAERIQTLLRAIENGIREDRTRASLRLVVAGRLGGLRPAEIRKLKKALWSRRDPLTRLPPDTGIRLTALLRYCPFPEKEWRAVVKRAFLDVPIPRVRVASADGKGVSFDQRTAVGRISDLQDITTGLWTPTDARRFTVRWTAEESATLVSRIEEWWEAEKSAMSPQSTFEKVFGSNPIRDCVDEIIDFIGSALALTVAAPDGNRLLSVLDSFEAAGIDILVARPAMLRFGIDRDVLQRHILNDFSSVIPDDVRRGCRAIQHWLVLAHMFKWAAVPASVVDALVWKISFRRGPQLDTTMEFAAFLLRRRSLPLNTEQIDRLLIALGTLLSETALPEDPALPLLTRGEHETIQFAERPHHRLAAARLARNLERLLRRTKRDTPSVIEKWKEISGSSPLPELRSVWSSADDVDE